MNRSWCIFISVNSCLVFRAAAVATMTGVTPPLEVGVWPPPLHPPSFGLLKFTFFLRQKLVQKLPRNNFCAALLEFVFFGCNSCQSKNEEFFSVFFFWRGDQANPCLHRDLAPLQSPKLADGNHPGVGGGARHNVQCKTQEYLVFGGEFRHR